MKSMRSSLAFFHVESSSQVSGDTYLILSQFRGRIASELTNIQSDEHLIQSFFLDNFSSQSLPLLFFLVRGLYAHRPLSPVWNFCDKACEMSVAGRYFLFYVLVTLKSPERFAQPAEWPGIIIWLAHQQTHLCTLRPLQIS